MKSGCIVFALCGTVLLGAEPQSTAVERLGITFNPPMGPAQIPVTAPESTDTSTGVSLPPFTAGDSAIKPIADGRSSPEGIAAQSAVSENLSIDVVTLPKFDVKGSRIKVTEDDVRTPEETLALAKKEYISPLYQVTFGPLSQLAAYYLNFPSILGGWHPGNAEAMTLHAQDLRVRKMKEFDDMVDMTALVDPKEAKTLKLLRVQLFRLPQQSHP
jgi:hypothetical protein